MEKIKIKVKKPKQRIPLPKKPPKVIKDDKVYDRKKMNRDIENSTDVE
jgi:hypothetical protein